MSMRLYRNQIPKLVDMIMQTLIENEFVEIAKRDLNEEEDRRPSFDYRKTSSSPSEMMNDEFKKDINSVLYNYLQTDRRLTDEARTQVERRGEDSSLIYSVKRRLAKRENFGLNDEAPGFIVEQLIEALLHAKSVEEIYSEDHEIKAVLLPKIREIMGNQRNLQQEVEQRIKHLERGSTTWEDQYFLVSQRLKEKYQID